MNINSLPDLVLRHIFSHLPLLDQLHLHHVCPKWQSLQPSVTCTRKCLTLFIGELSNPPPQWLIAQSPLTIYHLDQIETDSCRDSPSKSILEFSEINPDLITRLVSLFPHISSLCLVLNQIETEAVVQAIHLLESWSKCLESLSFYCQFDRENDDGVNLNDTSSEQLLKLIRYIDEHCSALDCLTLDVDERLYQLYKDPSDLDLPCLARLKEFQFCSCDNAEILFKSLKQYGNGRLERISIGNECDDDISIEFAQHPQIASKFAALPSFILPRQRQFFNTFNSLTTLKFDLDDLTLSELTAYLAPLHSLLYLHLTIDFKELSQYDATPTYEFDRLASVKILCFTLFTRTHTNFNSRHWSTIFPSVQLVELYYIGVPCGECAVQHNPESIPDGAAKQSKRNPCLKKLLGPLKQCDKLKKITTHDHVIIGQDDDDIKEWTIEELN